MILTGRAHTAGALLLALSKRTFVAMKVIGFCGYSGSGARQMAMKISQRAKDFSAKFPRISISKDT